MIEQNYFNSQCFGNFGNFNNTDTAMNEWHLSEV